MKRVGIFGGSFNPIHCGHIALAQQLLATVDEVWLMVSPQNPLKQQDDLLADELRLDMARRAVEGVEGVVACDYEFRLPRPSYTWTTLQALSRDYPDIEFVLLLGGDNWARFQRWWHWKDILWHYRVIVYPRDNHPGTVDAELLPVSSTEVRARVRAGLPVTGLVPPQIERLVKEYYAT
jgi:nicotinate-nucleotide adenylyltransferase